MKSRTPSALTILLALLFVFASCSKDKPDPEPETEALKPTRALQTFATPSNDSGEAWTDSTATSEALPRMIDLGRGKCIPCRKMEPILKELKQVYAGKAGIKIISLDEHADAAEEYNLRVIPTQIFFDAAGSEVWRHDGFLSRDAIVARFTEMGVEPVDD